ncbi:MAG: hypothetical protein HUU20_27635 [Pirellulales bacterium]|nr:hypothetical protein [Pirellulales bacterium]
MNSTTMPQRREEPMRGSCASGVDFTAAVALTPARFRGLLVGSDRFVAKMRRLLGDRPGDALLAAVGPAEAAWRRWR